MVASRTRLLQLLLVLLRHVQRRRLGLLPPPPPSSSSPSWQSQKGGLSLGHSRAADDGAAAAGVSAGRRIGSGWRVSSIILDFLLLPPRYSAYRYKAPLGGGAGGVGRRQKLERRRGGATKHQDYMRSTVSGVLSFIYSLRFREAVF